MRRKEEKLTSIEKALKVLMVFTPSNKGLGTVEISHKLGFYKATVSRILLVLTKAGFLQRDKQSKKYSLGHSAIKLGMAVNQSIHNNLVYFAKPYIDDLRDRVKETVVLEVLFGEDMIMAYIAEGPQLIRIAGRIGDRVPVHAAAGAKAILAFSSPGTRSALLNVEMSRFTKQTITNPADLEKQLNEIKQMGISFDNEEINEGTSAIGAPVFNHEKKPVASVVIAAPSRRIKNSRSQEMILMLKETAENISKRLYYRGPSS